MKSRIKFITVCGLCAVCAIVRSYVVSAQTIYQYKAEDATICFFDKSQSQYIPHLIRKYELGRALHAQIWDTLPSQAPFMMLTDWEDDGNAGGHQQLGPAGVFPQKDSDSPQKQHSCRQNLK